VHHIFDKRYISGYIYDLNIYILLTKREGHTGRILARGLGSTDRAQRGPCEKVRSRSSLVNKRFITRLKKAKTCKDTSAGSFGTMPGPILREYWTGNRVFWLADFSYWPSDCLNRVIKSYIQLEKWMDLLKKWKLWCYWIKTEFFISRWQAKTEVKAH